MLKKIKARLACHGSAFTNSVRLLTHKPWGAVMTIMVIAITLTLPALFWVFTQNMQQLTQRLQGNGHMSLYLEPSISASDETALLNRVLTTTGVDSATLKSAADGLAELQSQEGMRDIMEYLPDNPLPATIEVVPAAVLNTPEQLNTLYQVLKSYPNVAQAKFDMQWVSRLYLAFDFAAKIARAMICLLALAVILIIGNTLRMTIHSRHDEIHVLTLIGASDAYITRPFLYLGVAYAVIGAVLAVLFVNVLMNSLAALVNQLTEVSQVHYLLKGLSIHDTWFLLLSAMALGWLGACLSVRSLRMNRG